jgi:hypothetical protein
VGFTNAIAGGSKARTARPRLGMAVRHGLDNMPIQAFLIAAAINLKRLAAALRAASWPSISDHRGDRAVE